jgi:LytR cell envelope-related transcriptional attenuator
MSPTDVEHASTVVRSRQQLIRDRRRRQTYTFVSVFAVVLLIGLVALGNWQAWWTIGGSAQAATICPEQTVIQPRFTNVVVVNATDRKGLAAAVAKELQKRQFKVLTLVSETPDKPINLVAQVRYGEAGTLAAHTVSLQFPAKIAMVKDDREDESVDVVLGEKYKGMVSGKKGLAAITPKEDPRGCVPATTAPEPSPSAS